ncbi:hypothetical protein [Sorangium cellulosum]|uniref:hypothetical protein n=1 Tax=Sorangium cellulosum TaxID=56 RepID=UPI0010130C6A|nr:hypothetical protein [Sorangium cellulosum]
MDAEGTGTPRSAGTTARDAAEIRGRITACFSVVELRRFAEELGEPGIPWDRGIQGATHELVRRFEQRGELWGLVAQLRQVRPLVEWPDMPTVPPPSSLARAAADIPRPAPLPRISPLPVASPPQHAPTLGPPPIPPTTRTPAVPGAALTRARSPDAREPAHGPPGAPGAAAGPPDRGSRRVDPRLLLAALGLVVASLIVAFLMGRASSEPAGEEARAGEPAGEEARASERAGEPARASGAPTSSRPEGIAARAAAAVARRVESVARVCEIPPGPAEDVMRRAFERCGPASLAAQRAGRAAPAEPPDQPAADEARAQRAPAAAAPRAPAAAGNAGCLSACERRHRACRTSECGKEPTQSSQYQRYQACLSTCLEQASKCRLGCL